MKIADIDHLCSEQIGTLLDPQRARVREREERERDRERQREREREREGEKEERYGQNVLTCQCKRHSCKKLRLCVYERLLPRRQVMFHRSITNSSFARMAPITAGYRRSLCLLLVCILFAFYYSKDFPTVI